MNWDQGTATVAVITAVEQRVKGERDTLLLVCSVQESDDRVRAVWGFVPGIRNEKLPATRAVMDLIAAVGQDMRIPYEILDKVRKHAVAKGQYNIPVRRPK